MTQTVIDHYEADLGLYSKYKAEDLCVIAILDPKKTTGIQEFYVVCNYDMAVWRHLEDKHALSALSLRLIPWKNIEMSYPAGRIAYIRRLDEDEQRRL